MNHTTNTNNHTPWQNKTIPNLTITLTWTTNNNQWTTTHNNHWAQITHTPSITSHHFLLKTGTLDNNNNINTQDNWTYQTKHHTLKEAQTRATKTLQNYEKHQENTQQ